MLFFVVSLLFPWCIFSQKQDLIIPIPKPLTKRFYKLPVLVETVRQKSIVGIRVIIPRFNYGNNSSGPHSFINVGIVAKDDGIIITSAHTFGESQAEWYHENTSVFVYDESRAFTAKLIDLDPEADLAKIKIENLNEHMPPFSKKAALFATQREKELISDFKNFYSFGFWYIGGTAFIWPHILGPYLMETNLFDDTVQPLEFGVVSASAVGGLSGGALIGPDGKAYGIISRTTQIHVYVTSLEEVKKFINDKPMVEPQ
jgi:S1-C subfamily serine protease